MDRNLEQEKARADKAVAALDKSTKELADLYAAQEETRIQNEQDHDAQVLRQNLLDDQAEQLRLKREETAKAVERERDYQRYTRDNLEQRLVEQGMASEESDYDVDDILMSSEDKDNLRKEMDASRKEPKARRSTLRKQVTRVLNEFNAFQEANTCEDDFGPSEFATVKSLQQRMQVVRLELAELDAKILLSMDFRVFSKNEREKEAFDVEKYKGHVEKVCVYGEITMENRNANLTI